MSLSCIFSWIGGVKLSYRLMTVMTIGVSSSLILVLHVAPMQPGGSWSHASCRVPRREASLVALVNVFVDAKTKIANNEKVFMVDRRKK
jgi:hypothetical protein